MTERQHSLRTPDQPNNIDTLLQHYDAVEKQFDTTDARGTYANLVTSIGNGCAPVQRWFHFKEAYSLDLLQALLVEWGIAQESVHRVLDPFCGVGTTLLAVQKLAKQHDRDDLEVVGIERNPFLHFATQTKLRWSEIDVTSFDMWATHLLSGAVKPGAVRIPDLSTLHRTDIYDPEVISLAVEYQQAINSLAPNRERDALLLGYASILEDISGARKDGRALRVEKTKQRAAIRPALEAAWNMISCDIARAAQIFAPIRTDVLLGDGRTLLADGAEEFTLGEFDLVIFSPPYLNNIDYTEVYKVELWMCGFVQSQEEFKGQRLRTLRSHPSVRFPDAILMADDPTLDTVCRILDDLVDCLPRDQYFSERSRYFRGYFDDLYRSLKALMRALRPGGWAFCVVGNSLHGPKHNASERIPVASDLLIALIAFHLGFEVKGIQVARHLTRRSPAGHYVRESIIVMQKRG